MADIDTIVKGLRDEMSIDLHKEACRIDSLVSSIQNLQSRMTNVESRLVTNDITGSSNRDPSNDPDLSITVSGIQYMEGETVLYKARSLIQSLGDDVSINVHISGASRLPNRLPNKPSLMKISFENREERILVLKHKSNLRKCPIYKNVCPQLGGGIEIAQLSYYSRGKTPPPHCACQFAVGCNSCRLMMGSCWLSGSRVRPFDTSVFHNTPLWP